MPTATLRSGIYSYTQSAKPSQVFNNPAVVLLGTANVNPGFWWTSLASIAAEASVGSPVLLEFYAAEDMPAVSRTWTARPCGPFKASTLTHNTKPTASATTSATVTTPGAIAAGTLIAIDVTTIVQGMRAGTIATSGYFQISVNDATPRKVRGFSAGTNKPALVVPYDTGTPAPARVIPNGGAVGTRQPIVSWDPWASETGQQLQVASDSAFTSIVFDSGMVNVTAGQFDLTGNGAGYQLPVGGGHVYARAKRNGPLGPSDWSPVVETWFTALPTVAITSPGTTTGDGTPPYVITATGGSGAIKGTRFITRRLGDVAVLDDSGEKPGSTLTYTPAVGLTAVGDQAVVEARATDSEIRQAVRNCPVYGVATKTWQLVQATGVTPPADLAATFPSRGAPWTRLTWSWTDLPDEWLLEDHGVEVARFTGASALQAGSGHPFAYTDYTATGYQEHHWTVVPLSNGVRGAASNVVTATPRVIGIFLLDVDTGEEVQLLGLDEVDPEFAATVYTSSPLGRGWTSVREVDRQLGTYPIKGEIHSKYDRDAQATADTLEAFAANASTRNLRLAYTTVNVPVAVHSITLATIRRGISSTLRFVASYTAVTQGTSR